MNLPSPAPPPSPPQDVIDTGLWRYSRHPNYLGELMFWFGLYAVGLSAGGLADWWWSCAGAFIIVGMFLGASIPMMEERQLQSRPAAYRAYMQRVPSPIFFWFRRQAAE